MRSRAVSLPGGVLLVKTRLAAAQLGAAFEVREDVVAGGHETAGDQVLMAAYALTACDFSQSLRNFSSPMLVSG